MSKATLPWIGADGALYYEMDTASGSINKEKHWWVQAEAMAGFYNAYQLTGETIYLRVVKRLWAFIKKHLLDKENGEWYWGVKENYELMQEPKAGFWKCPYHNSRACLGLIKRITADIK
ncbi:MAG: AGE family epimerase/isomerase [Niabella sp.]